MESPLPTSNQPPPDLLLATEEGTATDTPGNLGRGGSGDGERGSGRVEGGRVGEGGGTDGGKVVSGIPPLAGVCVEEGQQVCVCVCVCVCMCVCVCVCVCVGSLVAEWYAL